jgi:hypothetical protein
MGLLLFYNGEKELLLAIKVGIECTPRIASVFGDFLSNCSTQSIA